MAELQQISTLQHYDELEKFLSTNNIPRSKTCLVGSACLSVRQLREHNDLDVALHSSVNLETENKSPNIGISSGRYRVFGLSNNEIIGNSRHHDEIGEYKVIRPEIEFSYKRFRKKEKDMADVELLYQYRTKTDDWNTKLELYNPPQDIGSLFKISYQNPTRFRTYLRWYRKENPLFGSEGYKKRSVSIVGRTIDSYKRDGIKTTINRGVRLLKENEPTGLWERYSHPIRKIRLGNVVQDDVNLQYPVRELLNEQFDGDEFTRYDLLVKYVLADDSVDAKTKRSITDNIGHIDEWLISGEGITDSVQIDYERNIKDGDSFIHALINGYNTVDVDISPGNHNQEYRRSYLDETQLTDSEIEFLEKRLTELLHQYGLLFQIVLWPPAETFMDDIIDRVDEYGDIRSVDVLELTEDEFDDCVMDFYAVQDQNSDFIRDKINVISEYGSTIHILSIKLADPELRDDDSKTMVHIKETLRREFIPEISLDLGKVRPLVHGTDDYEHNILTSKIVRKYQND